MSTIQISPEELDRDALLQFFALSLLQGLMDRGIISGKRRSLLTGPEQRLVQEAKSKGLMDFPDEEVEAAVLWCAAGCNLALDEDKLRHFLGLEFH